MARHNGETACRAVDRPGDVAFFIREAVSAGPVELAIAHHGDADGVDMELRHACIASYRKLSVFGLRTTRLAGQLLAVNDRRAAKGVTDRSIETMTGDEVAAKLVVAARHRIHNNVLILAPVY